MIPAGDTVACQGGPMATFFAELKEQRWDDHRYYHHSRVNQTLHLISACSFLVTYALLFTHPVIAALFGWTFAMCIRQVGHFFFEPKGYDEMNQATHEYKEQVKVGYNLRRKVILHSVWGVAPLLLLISPTFFGVFSSGGFLDHLAVLWLCIAVAAMIGLVWFTKILTDPFNDFWQYRGAPLALFKGELLDPMTEAGA